MSILPFAETIKNTIEVLNEIYDIQNSGLQWVIFLKFLWNVLMDWIVYIFTFQWMDDFIQLPIIIPQVSESIFSDLLNFLVPTDSHLVDPQMVNTSWTQNFFTSDSSVIQNGIPIGLSQVDVFFKTSFLSGFLNCFFLYFPLSPVQFIWLRRVIIDGPWAGRAATIGIIFGHLSLLGFCLFGFRDIINVWFGLEPFSYFLGIWLIFTVIFEMAHSPFRILKKSQRSAMTKIFLINFGLVWTDQSGLYQFFGNLSLHSGVSPIDFSFYNSEFSISFYFFGIIIGSFFWTYLISQGILRFGYLFPRIAFGVPYSYWIRGFHYFCLISCITLTLTSFPYYGLDYLFTNPLGFFPQDNVFKAADLLKTDTRDTKKGRLGDKSSFASIDTDLSLFDRGRYAGGPVVEFHIESLNYQEEYAWRSRIDRLSSRGLTRGGGGLLDKYLTTQLGPVEEALKKQRREKKREQQIQKFANFTREIQAEKDLKNEPFSVDDSLTLSSLPTAHDDQEDQTGSKDLNRFVDQSPNDLIEDYEYLIERFVENYTAEANKEDSEVPNLVDEKMIHFSAFSEIAKYGFDVFSMFESVELDPVDEELAKEIKEKFSENLIYRFLVNYDISNFLKRQPKEHKLTSQDEISLFEKRLALAEYYDTLRSYSQLPAPFSDIFQPLFCGPKSYVNRIYNQQFKGTLKIVERLFSIHLEDDENIPNLTNGNTGSEIQKETTQKSPQEEIYLKFKKDPSVLKFDQPLYITSARRDERRKNPLIHEQFLDQMQSSIQEANLSPFLRDGKPLPFFVGWDNQQRKFIVTNRLLTRQKTLSNTSVRTQKTVAPIPGADFQISKVDSTKNKQKVASIPRNTRVPEGKSKVRDNGTKSKRSGRAARVKTNLPEKSISSLSSLGSEFTWKKLAPTPSRRPKPILPMSSKPKNKKNLKNFTIQNFQFTTWPVTEKALKMNPLLSRLYRTYDEMKMTGSADDVFKYAEPQMEEESLIYDRLPNIVQRIEMKNKLQMSLAPTRGGFIWPGNEPLKFKFTQLSQQLQTLQKWFKKDSLPPGKLSGKNRF